MLADAGARVTLCCRNVNDGTKVAAASKAAASKAYPLFASQCQHFMCIMLVMCLKRPQGLCRRCLPYSNTHNEKEVLRCLQGVVTVQQLDLADLQNVRAAAKNIEKEDRIDGLILNAGVMFAPKVSALYRPLQTNRATAD